MSERHTYHVKSMHDLVTGRDSYEVWGRDTATGREWLIVGFNTLAEAEALIASWQEAGA